MDELMISGRRYVSSARAAKEHGYHSDYIGQLIRGSKVKGQKVGRAWYVDAESLAIYLGKEIRQAVAEQEAIEKNEIRPEDIVKAEISPELKTLREREVVEELESAPEVVAEEIIKEEERRVPIAKLSEKSRRVSISEPEIIAEIPRKMSGLKYISDEEPLLPEIQKNKMVSRDFEDEPIVTEEPVHIKIEERPARQGYLKQGIALAALGVVVLIVITAASSLFVYSMSVGSQQTAGVQFSLPQ